MLTGTIIATIILISVTFHLWLKRISRIFLPAPDLMDFKADLYCVEETVFAIRHGGRSSSKTVVCMPGFTETMSYFVELYKDQDCQLILVNNCLYHSPFAESGCTMLSWDANPYQQATIEHDGFYLARIIQNFATHSEVFLHGHSRGAAVILDAGRQFPDITRSKYKTVTAILETPVVPKGKALGVSDNFAAKAVTSYFIPLVFWLYSFSSEKSLTNSTIMNPTNSLKLWVMMQNLKSPKHYWIYVVNINNITRWQEGQTYSLYENFYRIFIVQGERDDVLDNIAIEASALEGAKLNNGLQVVKTENTNHFVSLEQPHYILDVINLN